MQGNTLLFASCMVAITLSVLVRGQDQPAPDPAAIPEVTAGVCAFKTKDYKSAEQHFRQALFFATAEKRTYKLQALALEMQYKKDDQSPANQAIGRRAIEAYAKFLDAYPAERTAVMESAQLYTQAEAANLDKLVMDEKISPDVRAEIYVRLSADASRCANTLLDQNRQVIAVVGKQTYQFKKPTNQADLEQADSCAAKSLELANRALALCTDQRSALSELGSAYGAMSMVASWKGDTTATSDLRNKAKASYDKYSAEQKRLDEIEYARSNQPNDDEIRNAQMARAADFVATGKMVRRPNWEQLTEPVHPSYDEIFGPEPRPVKRNSAGSNAPPTWRLFRSTIDGFSATFPWGVMRDHAGLASTYRSGSYLLMVMPRPLPQPAGVQEETVQAMTAWGAADATCNFVRMGGSVCDVRLIGPKTIASHNALFYRLDQIDCGIKPGILAVVSTPDRIFTILIHGGNENSAEVKRFLASLKID